MPYESNALNNNGTNNTQSDCLYHLGIDIADITDTTDIERQFGDVKFVCMGGTKERMATLAQHLRHLIDANDGNEHLVDLCERAQRFAIFKVGVVLCCSHGIGMSSMSVLLHELIKLLRYAKCQQPVFIRVGTCGGLGVAPGTVVVTKDAYNGYLRNEHEIAILGRRVVRPAKFDAALASDIVACGRRDDDDFECILGNTMAADCFYEGQARLNGAICDYGANDRMAFLQRCHREYGIRNMEMEATMFASLTLQAGVRAADVCVTLLNRLNGDELNNVSTQRKQQYERRPLVVVGRYIQKVLSSSATN